VRRTERLAAVLERLSSNGSVGVRELADGLGASPATVRRDLQYLQEQRLLQRSHGGAVAHGTLYELPLRYRGGRAREEKRRIALEAVQRVDDNATVALTGGTTTTEVARALVDRHELVIVTNAINIASELAVRQNLKLIVTGGVARSASYELVGSLAEATLADLHIDVAFVGVDAISGRAGLMTHDEVEAHTNRALIVRSSSVIVVADASKVGRAAFARICDLDDVSELITDAGADEDAVEALRSAGLTVTVV
jgi:DeoR family transcriptional regulator of aga operon